MHNDIKQIMERYTQHWVLNKALAQNLANFVKGFINKNEEHVAFFGSNLLGVNFIKFGSSDRLELTEEILQIDDLSISKEVKELPHIGSNWKRGTDGLNLALLYLVHLLAVNTTLPAKQKYEMQVNALLIFQYKVFSSTYNEYFNYAVSEEIALAVYQSLSGKYLIKKYGTWQELFLARCDSILIHQDTHKHTIKYFEPDDKIQYMITDIQGRHKQIILEIYDVIVKVKDQDIAVSSSSSMITLDGELTMRDITRKQNDYLNYIRKVSLNKNEFIKQDLVEVINDSITTMPRKIFLDCLVAFTEDAKYKRSSANDLMEEIIFYSFTFFNENRDVITDIRDFSKVIKTMKDQYTAGKSTNPSVLKSRKLADKVLKKVTKSSNPTVQAAVRIGLILYILLRTLTKDHYN